MRFFERKTTFSNTPKQFKLKIMVHFLLFVHSLNFCSLPSLLLCIVISLISLLVSPSIEFLTPTIAFETAFVVPIKGCNIADGTPFNTDLNPA